MEIVYCEQRSKEWLDLRVGVVTASAAHKLSRADLKTRYCYQIMAELLTGTCIPIPVNEDMQRGIDLEPEACSWYEEETETKVEHVGFVYKDSDHKVGCSPDGLVGQQGLVEFKCPRSYIHLQNVERGPRIEYERQIQFQMWVTGRAWCDFVTYNKDMPKELKGFIHRIPRNENMIEKIEKDVTNLLMKIDKFFDRYIEKDEAR